MNNKYKKRDRIFENEIASLVRKYNIKQAIDIIFPRMRWFFYVVFILSLVSILLFILQEFFDFSWGVNVPFLLLKITTLLSALNILVLVVGLWIKGYIHLVKKLFFLRLFISILSGWLIFFSSEEFWQIEFSLKDKSYLTIVIVSILFIIIFFMMIEIKALIPYKRVYDRVLIVIGISLIISTNIGVFFMPNVLVGILDNNELLINNEGFKEMELKPFNKRIDSLVSTKNKIDLVLPTFEMLFAKADNLRKLKPNKFIIFDKVYNTNIFQDSLENITNKTTSNSSSKSKASSDNGETYKKKKQELDTLYKKLKELNKDFVINKLRLKTSRLPEKLPKMPKQNKGKEIKTVSEEEEEEYINEKVVEIVVDIYADYKRLHNESYKNSTEIINMKNRYDSLFSPKNIRTWLTKDHGKYKHVLIEGEINKKKFQYHPKLLIFQIFLAMFFGVFMQLLIQDKTVTESI